MVFSGKPSTGCQMCRTRRIKCDEAKPSCSQCVRTGRTCPGYKSQIDLLFRNETGASAAEKRARNAARKKASTSAVAGPSAAAPSQAAAFSSLSVSDSTSSTPSMSASSQIPIQPRKPPTAASRKNEVSNRKGKSPINVHSNSSNVRIETLNPRGHGDGGFSVADTLPTSHVLTHRQTPDYERGGPGRPRITGFIEDQEEDSSSSNNNQLVQTQRRTSDQPEVIIPALTPSPEELAIHHFFANYIMVPFHNSSRGYMDFLLPLIEQVDSPLALSLAGFDNTSNTSSSLVTARPSPREASLALSYAFRACALASMGTRVASDSFPFSDKALSAYTRALAATHLALQDPELRRADSTLAAVLLLGIFESITAKQLGLFAWGSHIEGAVEIVKSRSKEQRYSKTGRSLFVAVRTQMTIHCLASGKAPDMGYEWWFDGAVSDSIAAHCQRLSIRAAELRAEASQCLERVSVYMARKTPEAIELVNTLAKKAYDLDRECAAWAENLTSEWVYHPMAWQESLPEDGDYSHADVFPGRVDVYPDLYIVGIWNQMRSTRLCLSSIGVRCAAWNCWPADYRTTPQYAEAANTSREMIAGIISSVPYYLGYHQKYNPFGGGRHRDGWTWLGNLKSAASAESAASAASTTSTSPSPEPDATSPPREATAPWLTGPIWQLDLTTQPEQASHAAQAAHAAQVSTAGQASPSLSTGHGMLTTMHTGYAPFSSFFANPVSTSTQTSPPAETAESPASASSSAASSMPSYHHPNRHSHSPDYQHQYFPGSSPDESIPLSPRQAGWLCGDDSDLKGLSGYFLTWPLANVASQDYTTDAQREWVRGRLKYISSAMGVRYAEFLSGIKFRAPSMIIMRDRLIAQAAYDKAMGKVASTSAIATPYADRIGIKSRKAQGAGASTELAAGNPGPQHPQAQADGGVLQDATINMPRGQ